VTKSVFIAITFYLGSCTSLLANLNNDPALPILQKQSKGVEVHLLQKILKRLGYEISFSNEYDAMTEKAVTLFQQKHRLPTSGIVNDSTWKKLLHQKFENQLFIKGIDVSHYENEEFKNGEFPFEKLKYFDIDFCIVKGSHGADKKDDFFNYNFSRLEEEHLIRGAYHFFSLLKDDIDQQIANFLSLNIDFKAKGVLPPVLDVEEDCRPFDKDNIILNQALVQVRIKIWLEAIETATGRKPIIYCRKSFWEDIIGNPSGFESYPLWVAYYREELPPKMPNSWNGKWTFWQHTDKGVLNNIGKYDLNRFNGSLLDLLQLSNFELQ
jgi:GH25 family lysozyme M1 (1,4-beta-N-acetylmuramidase)